MPFRFLTVCLFVAAIGCGTPTRDGVDDDLTTDAGSGDGGEVDGGDADGGDADGGDVDGGDVDGGDADGGDADGGDVDGGEADGGETCVDPACSVDISGDYDLLVSCSAPIGVQGPLPLTLSAVCGCEFEACQGTDCNAVELDTSTTPATLAVTVVVSGMSVTCTGPYEDGAGTLNCDAGFFQCPATLTPKTGP